MSTNGNGAALSAKGREAERETAVRPQMVQKAAKPRQAVDLGEIGITGLRHFGGFVAEEWLTQLTGRRGVRVWREMSDNDPVIGAFLFAIKMLARAVEVTVEEGSDPQAAELVEECMHDMDSTWDDFVCEALSMLTYGWAFHELVYKRRRGPDPGGKLPASRFDDGKVGWKDLPIRAQETLWQWEFDPETGQANALVQVAYDGVRRIIPFEKALLFRTETTRGNPEGRSILRNAFVPWFRKKNIEEVEAIGVARDLAGIPVLTPPDSTDLMAPQHAELKEAAQELVTTIARDEDEGVVLPQNGWTLQLLASAGSRQIDTDAIVKRYDQRIATTVLADFIMLGQDAVGSYALSKVKVDTFGEAMGAWLGAIAKVLNRQAIPKLLRLNGLSVDEPPQIHFADPGKADLDQLGTFLQSLSLAGAPDFWSEELLQSLFELAGLPAPELNTPEPAEKADPTDPADIGLVLYHKRAPLLEQAFQRDVQFALGQVGETVADAYTRMVAKATTPTTDDRSLVQKLLTAVGLEQVLKDRLGPVYTKHYNRVLRDTLHTLKAEIGLETDVPDEVGRRILREGGSRLGLLDVEKQAREAIYKALADGRAAGDNPVAIARRIREYVPAGRFTKAGSPYRSKLIARTETLNAMRLSSLAAYRAAPNVTAVMLRDGLLPTSDAECEARDGDIVSFDEAEAIAYDEHPMGTLSLSPVVT